MHGELLAERFRIGKRLGAGAVGEVWAAQDERMGRDVAVKLVHALFETREAETQARFRREVQLVGRLSHSNIVTVHDWGEVPVGRRPLFYLVMELVRGASLGQRLKQGAPSWPLAVGWAAQIAQALDAAHRQGVVHRDIKPANVLLTPEGTAKVLDFGVAKFIGETMTVHDLTAPGAVLGSPPYMSPEQAEGAREIDHRSDLYSLGCLLYHAVTGRPPFVSDNPLAVLRMQLDDAPVAPSALVDGLPGALNDLILSLLAKHPEDRPADAAVVNGALGNILVEQSVAQGDGTILEAANLGHADSAAGRILGKAWELWQQAEAGADEVLRTARADAVALRNDALARIDVDRRIARALGKELEEKASIAEVAAEEAERRRESAEIEARRLREQAAADAQRLRADAIDEADGIREEARRVREEALADAERIREEARRQAAVQLLSPPAPVVSKSPGAAVDTMKIPRFADVNDGYDREQVDAALASMVLGLESLSTVAMEQSVMNRIVTRLGFAGRPPDEVQRTAENIFRSALRQAERQHAARSEGQAARDESASPMLFPLARRGYDRAQVDTFIHSVNAELERQKVRIAALDQLLKSEAAHMQRLKDS